MKTYEQTITFEKKYKIKAKNAKEANQKLEQAIEQDDFAIGADYFDFYEFEDESVDCPDCNGLGYIEGESEEQVDAECEHCGGDGEIEPEEAFD